MFRTAFRRRSAPRPFLALFVTCPVVALAACGDGGPTDPVFDLLQITTTVLPPGNQGVPYDATLEADGGDGAYRWAVIGAMQNGSPPSGLTVATSGVISGTPSFVETQGFTVEVRSGDGQIATAALSITIDP